MTSLDNYIQQTVKQYHGRPIQKRLRILWFVCTLFLTMLWSNILREKHSQY